MFLSCRAFSFPARHGQDSLTLQLTQESCGFCTPCRDGLPWNAQVLDDIERGRGTPEDLDTLQQHIGYIGAIGNTHCALAPGAMEPLQSALKYFREDFQRHIDEGACPYGGAH